MRHLVKPFHYKQSRDSECFLLADFELDLIECF